MCDKQAVPENECPRHLLHFARDLLSGFIVFVFFAPTAFIVFAEDVQIDEIFFALATMCSLGYFMVAVTVWIDW